MRMLFSRAGLSLLFIILACDNPLPAGPDPYVPPPVVTEPPRVDQNFDMDNYRGVIAFGLGHDLQSKENVLSFVHALMGRGWNTFEICSETEFWDGTFAYPIKVRSPERLDWLLDIIARVPGAQVALIGNCTLKRQVPLSEQFNWAMQVAEVAKNYQNIAIFTHNEFDNCRGREDWGGNRNYCAGKEDVARHVRMYKSYGFRYVTADDSFLWPRPGDPPSLTYSFRLTNIGATPASFHPDREKQGQPWDPSPNQLQQLARFNGEYILSETVAWSDFSGRCDGLRTCDQQRIQNFINNCAAVPECLFTYHCEHCLNGEVPTFIPEAR